MRKKTLLIIFLATIFISSNLTIGSITEGLNNPEKEIDKIIHHEKDIEHPKISSWLSLSTLLTTNSNTVELTDSLYNTKSIVLKSREFKKGNNTDTQKTFNSNTTNKKFNFSFSVSDKAIKYPIKQLDHNQLEQWMEVFKTSSKSNGVFENKNRNESPLYPSSYSLLSHLDYTPSQRDQEDCGNCWAWAGTGALAIALDVNEEIKDRLSVQFINSCQHDIIDVDCCAGGFLSDLSTFYDEVGYTIPWSNTNANWQDGDASCNTLCSSIVKNPRYPISSIERQSITTHDVSQQTAISNIKDVLNNDKAVIFGFYLPTDADWQNFFDFWDDESEEDIWNPDYSCGHTWNNGGGHDTLCVGYDCTDPDNSYWIILNSWGTTNNRPNGLFRLDMDMDYSCFHYDPFPDQWYSFYWETLDVSFDLDYPTVITNSPTQIEETSARLQGTLQSNGSVDTTCYFVWDTDSGEPYSHNQSIGTVSDGSNFNYDVTGLDKGEIYYYNTKANNVKGWDSTGGEQHFLTKPDAPTGLTSIANSSSKIYLTWSTGNGADNTIIERNTIQSWNRGQGTEIYCGQQNSFESMGLAEGTTYYFQAWSYSTEAGLEQWSDASSSTHTRTKHLPTIDSEKPDNHSTNIDLTPQINISIQDQDGDTMNITWYSNSSGSWSIFGTNNSVENGTYNQMGNNFSSYGQTYWWNVSINDGSDVNNSHLFHFTTNYRPTPEFSFLPTNPTDLQTISFSDESIDYDGSITSWSWDFGDGDTSTDQHPTHQFDDDGSYTVTLNVTDDDGTTNETTQEITILNVRPVMNFTYDPSDPTDLQTITFTDNCVDNDGSIESWSWDFGDGDTSTDQHPTHQYDDDGSYIVILNVTDDDGATNETTRTISVSNVPPTVEFSYTPSKPNVNQTITFTDSSNDPDGSITSWSWDFGDGDTSPDQHPTHSYSDNGTYQVTLTLTDNDGDTNDSTVSLTVYWGPNANFTWEPLYPESNQKIYFNDSSIDYDGELASWSWDFGDGNTSSDQNANNTYSAVGSYSVTLNVTDDDDLYGIIEKTVIVNDPPEANFTFSPENPRTEHVITFNDTTIDTYGELVNWTWDFGDGNVSYEQNVTHSYADNGTYTVTLTIQDNCTASDVKIKEITVNNTPPHVSFTYNPTVPTDIDQISFNQTSTDIDGNIINWTWSFGDGNNSYESNASHTYADNGTYTVTLNITDDDGDKNETSIELLVENVHPILDFTYSPLTPIENEDISFNGTSEDLDGFIVNWTWEFEDGMVNYSQNFSHSFTVFDSYYVNLTVKDDDGDTSSMNKTIVMKNTTTNETNAGNLTTVNLTNEFNLIVKINTSETTNVNISKYSGNPSTKNTSSVNSVGKYYEIQIENDSTVEWPVNITIFYTSEDLSNASLQESQLLGLYYFDDAAQRWELYETTGVNSNYQSNGYEGFIWAEVTHFTNVTPGGDNISPGNVTGLTVTDTEEGGTLDLSWNEASDNTGVSYYRIYCDKKSTINTSSSAKSYKYTGLTNGETYTFNISAVDLGGNEGNQSESVSGTPSKESSNQNPGSPSPSSPPSGGDFPPLPTNQPPIAKLNGPYTGFVSVSISFSASERTDEDGNITSYEWDFGDGSTSSGATATHAYQSIGNYTITLTVTDENDCSSQNTSYAIIKNSIPDNPKVLGPNMGSINETISFTIEGNDQNHDALTFFIDWGDNYSLNISTTKNDTIKNVSHQWTEPGIYKIQVKARDIHNETSAVTTHPILISIIYVNELGMLIDINNDGIFDRFESNETKEVNLVEYIDELYKIDVNNDGAWDFTYKTNGELNEYVENKEDGESPGFELIYFIITILLIIGFYKRKRKK